MMQKTGAISGASMEETEAREMMVDNLLLLCARIGGLPAPRLRGIMPVRAGIFAMPDAAVSTEKTGARLSTGAVQRRKPLSGGGMLWASFR